ncbi:unnamed protein product [Prunus armeniaca]
MRTSALAWTTICCSGNSLMPRVVIFSVSLVISAAITLTLSSSVSVAEIPLLSRRSGQITLPQLQKERPVIIGIAAELFRVLILSSRERFGMTVTVSVIGRQVVLHGQDKAIVLRKEDCVIWIPVAGRFFLKFSTEKANALLNASILSNMVWLYGQSNGPSCMLNFPFGKLGSLTFYFGEDNAGSEDAV